MITVPTVRPAATIFASAVACAWPTTFGTSIGAAVIVIVICSLPGRLPLSVTDAVIVCTPIDSVAPTLAPVPNAPSRFEVQARFALRSPSSLSVAVPVSISAVPSTTLVPLAGAVIFTPGAVLVGSVLYSTCRSAAAFGASLYDVATRSPAPDKMKASELPCTQPARLTNSSIIGAIFAVR